MATESLALQLRMKRSEMMVEEVEGVALRLFEQRGFGQVTVEEIALEAHISARTFYRYFPAKEDVFQVQINRRSQGLRAALTARPADEPPLQSVRLALSQELAAEDPEVLRRWIAVIQATPAVLNGVLGGIQLKIHRVFAEFFGIPAATTPAIALFALRTGAAVVPGFLIWDAELQKHRLRLDPPVQLIDTGDLDRDVLENTRLFNKILEGYIRKYPDQWLWIHRRWKTRPEGDPPVY